jgi:SAM-dependent methyltransferase
MGTFLICSTWGQASSAPVAFRPVVDPLHPLAAKGFGAATDVYVRGRPDFPRESLDWLRDDLALGPGMTAVDLGAGTGKFTRLLLRTGAQVVAVEPVAAMRDRLHRDLPAVAALAGRAQQIPLHSECAHAVICAQAFHWFASAESLREIRRVLKPGGVLGLIWNVRDESVPWVAELTRILAPHEGDAPRYYKDEWRRVFPARGFGELNERTFFHEHVGPSEDVIVDRIASVSFIAALDETARNAVLEQVRGLIAATPELVEAEVRVPYLTRACCVVAC